MKKSIILAIVAAAMVSGCGEPEAAKPAGPPIAVSAADVSAAFQENEAKAKLAYDGKTLQITGEVKDITLDIMDKPVIALRGSGEQYGAGISKDGKMTDVSINDLPNEAAAAIKKGSEMTFICTGIGEAMGGAHLTDCKISG